MGISTFRQHICYVYCNVAVGPSGSGDQQQGLEKRVLCLPACLMLEEMKFLVAIVWQGH